MDPITRLLFQGSAGADEKIYIEDVFSTWLYTGNDGTQTITNGIDLSGKGGLVWTKPRVTDTIEATYNNHQLIDTNRGKTKVLFSNTTSAESTYPDNLSSFNSNGFTLGDLTHNRSGLTYASWTFRKAEKFFDVVTYTGTGVARTISHSLGSVPGCIIIKNTSNGAVNWVVYHRSIGATGGLYLNQTDSTITSVSFWDDTAPTSTQFTVKDGGNTNANGATYVAYLFAHDAGGFGDDGTESVIKCGSFTADGSGNATVDLGWEPQWLLLKPSSDTLAGWIILDNMRGLLGVSFLSADIYANSTIAEASTNWAKISSTGFSVTNFTANSTEIYIAIRRGPMKRPTDATKVFGLNARSGTGANATVTGGQLSDSVLIKNRGSAVGDLFAARLTGTGYLETSSTAAEVAAGATILQANPWDVMNGVKVGTTSTITNASSNTFINYLFRRAPGFFDVVTYTGTGSARTVSHNLGVAPELMIVKRRDAIADWAVVVSPNWNSIGTLQSDIQFLAQNDFDSTAPTSSVFSVSTALTTNGSGGTYVAYLFASYPGVSKVGSYTGTAATLNVDCGFTSGARFVMIKRTDSTGDWYVWDTTRGIFTGNDPYLLLNSTAAEVTNTSYIGPLFSGFRISPTAPVNASGGSFIYLAIA
jgi:hypothetical protein